MTIPTFKNPELLKKALTHRSYINEHPEVKEHNERLEFLGDAVLGYIVGDLLFREYEDMMEAQLTQLRASLVDKKQLAKFATQLGIGKMLLLGKGAEMSGGRTNPSLLSDAFEAIIGAYYLDSTITPVKSFIRKLFLPVADSIIYPDPEQIDPANLVDSKNRLQHWAAREYQVNPEYELVDEDGPPHDKEFVVVVKVNGKVYGRGWGKRKQDAEKRAAEKALRKLGLLE